jgi:hypothetical protein
MNAEIVTLDVRDDFRAGDPPCDKIKAALDRVTPAQTLRLLVPFEPVPLFEVARGKGLGHQATPLPGGDWEVLFSPDTEPDKRNAGRAAPKSSACGCGCSAASPGEIVELDARGLEPPQPMVRILEALAALPGDAELQARTDRRPVHLHPLLEQRAFSAVSKEQSDGSYVTHIRHG